VLERFLDENGGLVQLLLWLDTPGSLRGVITAVGTRVVQR